MKLKSTLLFLTLFISVLEIRAQIFYMKEYSYFYTIDSYDNLGYNPSEQSRSLVYQKRIENNVKGRESVSLNQKGDTIKRLKIHYNPKGRISRVEEFNKKGNKYEVQAIYSNDTLLTSYTTKRNKKHEEVRFEYNENGKLISLLHFKNGQKQHEIYKVYEGVQLIESVIIDHRKRKTKTSKLVNTINEEGRVVKTTYFFNDKLIRLWEYDCSDKGKKVKPKKNEEGVPLSSSCSWKGESNDGSYVIYYRTLNGKDISLYENRYNKDSVLVKMKIYDGDERLKHESTYYENHKINISHKKNGKIRSYFSEASNPQLGVISTSNVFYGLGKSHISSHNSYNEKGLLTEVIKNNNGKQNTTQINYFYFFE